MDCELAQGDVPEACPQAQALAQQASDLRCGIALAKTKEGAIKYRGRKPSFSRTQFDKTCQMLERDAGISDIAHVTGLSRQAIYRIKDDMVGSAASLSTWGM